MGRKYINRAIELLDQNQPIYYDGGHTGHELTFERGQADSKTCIHAHLPSGLSR